MNMIVDTTHPPQPVTRWTAYRLVGATFVFLCLFPWVSFGLLDLDTQPWFILAALVMCALSLRVKGDAIIVVCAVAVILAAIVAGLVRMEAADFLFFRGVLSYTAFGTVLLGYYFYRKKFGFPFGVFVTANIVWLLVGLIQLLTTPDIFEPLVVVRTTPGRGVTSLAPEPTFYGMVLLFLSWILLIEFDYRMNRGLWLLVFANILAILLVAKSAMAFVFIFFLLFTFSMFGISKLRQLVYALALLSVVVAAVGILNRYYPDWRLVQVATALADNPMVAIRADASINERFGHLAFALYGVVFNNGLPGGFNSFANITTLARVDYGDLFWFGSDDNNKIMSGVGAVVYELGWFSLLFFLVVFYCTLSKERFRMGAFHLVGFIATFAAALPVAFPLAPILLVTMLFWRRRGIVAPACDPLTAAEF